VEKVKPSDEAKRTFYSAMYILKMTGEFGYNCVKEPLLDWADEVAINWMDMRADEASAEIFARLITYMPERTRKILGQLTG